jgi:predicted DCC family thiol-disulfide oxidoreductase YuxK
LAQYGVDTKEADTFWLLEKGKIYSKSTAALRVVRQLKGPVKLALIFMLIPTGIRNVIYDKVAANRFRWFGKRESCMQPKTEIAERFIEKL